MDLIELTQLIKKKSTLSKILIFNDFSTSKYDLIELSKYFDLIYVSYYNNFANRNLMVQLRGYKNIHVIDPNSIPILNYDIIVTSELTNPILLILSRIKYIKFFYCSNTTELDVEIPGFKKDVEIQNLYIKNHLIITVDEMTNSSNSIKKDLISLNKEEITKNNINDLKTENILKTGKQIPIRNSNFIVIKNIVSSLTKFSYFKEESSLQNGELDICCILSSKKDNDLFLKTIEYLNNNYSYVKYFIFLNGKTILKYFKEEKLKSLEYFLIKSKTVNEFKDSYNNIFELLANGSYKINMNEINFDEEMIDLL